MRVSDTREERQRPIGRERKPHILLGTVIELAEAREWHNAPAFDTKQCLPMHTGRVADGCGPAIGFHPEEIWEIPSLPFARSFPAPLAA